MARDWAQEYLDGQLGVSAEQMLGECVGALIFDENMKILSATRMAARLMGSSVKDLIGANFVEALMAKPVWSWVEWVNPTQQLELLENILKDAVKFTSTGREVNILTRGQMLYRGNVNVVWRESDRTFALWINIVDPLTNSDESIAMTAWVEGSKLHGSLGNVVTQAELELLLDYCRTKTVKELAELHNTTPKAMEHKLRNLAERYGCGSITELAKHQMHRRLVNVSRPSNTLRVYTDLSLLDAVRYRTLPKHVLPRISGVTERSKSKDPEDLTRNLVKNVFGDD